MREAELGDLCVYEHTLAFEQIFSTSAIFVYKDGACSEESERLLEF